MVFYICYGLADYGYCPELEGCHTQGDTLQGILDNIILCGGIVFGEINRL